MKTTLDIPSSLLADAMQITGERTKRAAVTVALEELIRRSRMKSLALELGNSKTFMTQSELQSLRLRESPQ
jgi:Arc/MetJ family transcription regulator